MSKVTATLKRLKRIVVTLEQFKDTEAAVPEDGCLYQTFNGSLVYVFKDLYGEIFGVVLKGGHGINHSRGAKAGETYSLDEDGYSERYEGEELVMSLANKLDIVLP